MRFHYLLLKIGSALELNFPFRHIQVRDFFEDSDFAEIVNAPEIAFEPQESDQELVLELSRKGYELIGFPGCVDDKEVYFEWHCRPLRSDHLGFPVKSAASRQIVRLALWSS